ncbi:ABC transporter permease [Mechercharimyces sp. CAU 1602]|uniref:ABC transporter permease n=1 Tax=Mechercharimyces sp. CAU 1602 TaxID=2973933 RepID=UPI00216375E7|nr:ABC transporter permease [Mechercharimyces sp. CAU 1602]MCS1352146.1 ABC transporter permease [Mechercharimyces sp. CAU 1602]
MKAYLQLTKVQLLLFLRNKNTIIWSLILPVFMILALGTLLGGKEDSAPFSLKLAVVDQDQSQASQAFLSQLQQKEGFTWSELEQSEDVEAGVQLLEEGELDALVVIKSGFSTQLQQHGKSSDHKILLYLDESNQTLKEIGSTLVEQAVDEQNKEVVGFEPRITVEAKNVHAKELNYIDFLVPGILSLLIMTNNLNGVAATIASWRERGILRRMQGTPLNSATFIAAQISARILLNGLQALVVVLVAYFVFGVHVYGSWLLLLLFILLGTLTFLSIGFIIASLAKTPESAGPIAGLISFPMIFVGGIFFPVRDLPGFLQPLVKAIPIGYLTDALRGVMNTGATIIDLWIPALVLSAWLIASFAIAAWSFRWDVD